MIKIKQTKIQTYRILLSRLGQEVYKGGNIEVLNKVLGKTFICNPKKSEFEFETLISKTIGSGSIPLFKYTEVI